MWLTVQRANRYKYQNEVSGNREGFVFLNWQKGSLKRCEIRFVLDKWLNDRVFDRKRLIVGLSDCELVHRWIFAV